VVSIWLVLDSDGARGCRFVEKHANDFGISEDVKIGVLSAFQEGMNVAMSRVLAFPIGRHITLPALRPFIS